MTETIKKFSANGNTFYLLDARKEKAEEILSSLARRLCQTEKGKKADGLLVLEQSKEADIKMRIFNADGSEAEMCGNGARCAAYYLKNYDSKKGELKFETLAGAVKAKINKIVKIQLTNPKDIRLNLPLEVSERKIHVSFINTGVPHVVVFVNNIKILDVNHIGSLVRNHEKFKPAGANVDFVEISGPDSLKIRTFERGVESETLACGTGAVAAALIAFKLSFVKGTSITIKPASGENLTVEFEYEDQKIDNVWLEGSVVELSRKETEI